MLAALCAALLVPATANAAAKRVVAIEWDTVENLHMLGMAPVGAADMKGYDTWVAAPRPRGMKDVGSRQSPSLERIAALRPDLIVVPDYRSTTNLSQLKRIAPVLVTHPYPAPAASSARWSRDFRRLADAVGRRSRGERVLQDLSNTLARNKAQAPARGARRAARGDLDPGRHHQRARDPHVHAELADRRRRAPARAARRLERQRPLRLHDGRPRGPLARAAAGSRSSTRRSSRARSTGITRQTAYKRLPVVQAKRVRTLGGTTWLFGGPRSTMLFADRLTAALT